MTVSTYLKQYCKSASAKQLAHLLADARASVAAFAAATQAHGSLQQNWIAGQTVVEYDHYPKGDVVDRRTGSQFYYHSHRHGGGEHGHVHLFWHASASGRRRYLRPDRPRWVRTAPSHLLAISLDARGLPVALFTVNQWVTDGHWFDAATTSRCVARFAMGEQAGYEHACVWLTSFVRMYRPLIDILLVRRDKRLSRRLDRAHALRDERLELMSTLPIDWAADLEWIESEAIRRGLAGP
ncbi:hypothetical protein H3H36_02400 [Duganella sp. FT3S]|uniref:DUF6969 domain-containing protein n=1 Tax=Rugamonas fusca TaxID=2758568 RepID=A0A7W2EE36_9BURK|nr:hypothetical protein [Rugamonas fusca]MBA5604214.1 hypothetical protein [Rugamonas fusca]